jgi:hypothetical protein
MINATRDDDFAEGGPEGSYANYLAVGHNVYEFVLDFGQVYAGSETRHMHTRIVTNPAYAKAMAATLTAALEQFERAFGTIPHAKEAEQ